MEMAKFATKSLLKKSGSLELNKSKKVTFNNTVKLFIDDRSKNSKVDAADIELKCIEISIVDKSNDSLSSDSLEDCKATDFLVHKVIYDNYILPENDEDLDFKHDAVEDETVVFEPVQEDEGLDFVVHKVTEHEDDLIEKDSDFSLENGEESKESSTLDVEESDTVTKFSKLSIENILEHDKIIAFIDQRNLGLKNTPIVESVSSSRFLESNDFFKNSSSEKLANNLVLSPPLQELSLEKIVKAHSNNILCELDISPLNSVQETDSDSDLSSEGTMIMMTTEECQKNEQHIRESLLRYQSKKEKAKEESSLQSATENSPESNDEELQERLSSSEEASDSLIEDSGTLNTSTEVNISDEEGTPDLAPPSDFSQNERTYSSSLPDTEAVYAKDNHLQVKNQNVMTRAFSEDCTNFKGKRLTSVEIPSDVREWKILSNPVERNFATNSNYDVKCADRLSKEHLDAHNRLSEQHLNFESVHSPSYFIPNGKTEEYVSNCNGQLRDHSIKQPETPHSLLNGFSSDHIRPKSDELESFVNESTERVERIRKRYHPNGRQHSRPGNSRQSPVRGIRPRFGSTAEILQMMQKQTNPPFMTYSGIKNHMSWPCEEPSDFHRTRPSNHFYVSQSLSSQCSSQSSIESYCEDPLNTSCDHFSISSCPSIMVNERGAPEGASPPNSVMGSEDTSDNPNGFVYFSMKV